MRCGDVYTLVLDIGKTHVKLQVVDDDFNTVCEAKTRNQVNTNSPFPQADTVMIWHWLITTLKQWAITPQITKIVVTTHGATAALIDRNKQPEESLVLPILDYEYAGVDECSAEYELVRPEFRESYSPSLPAGLNLGKQLFWLQKTFPTEFSQVTDIILYPQYWVWRLCGKVVNEVSSLGCHTDLWAPAQNTYSSLVARQGWTALLGDTVPAWQEVGELIPDVIRQTGLSESCKVIAGVHDSNASYLRYLVGERENNFTVISTGTWTILMSSSDKLSLDSSKDTLANVNVLGQAVPCARFMGGREYEAIIARVGGEETQLVDQQAIQHVLTQQLMVTPDFSGGNGPFGGLKPVLKVASPTPYAQAIASIYCALMIDQQLSQLGATGDIYIEGAFLKNPLMCQLVAQLRPSQSVYLSTDDTGTVVGAAMLGQWEQAAGDIQCELCLPLGMNHLENYKTAWCDLISAQSNLAYS